MRLWTAPSIRSCYRNALPLRSDSSKFKLYAAKGEFVSMQILIRNSFGSVDGSDIDNRIIKITGSVVEQLDGPQFDKNTIRVQAQQYISFSDGIDYPDAIANNCVVDIVPNTTQGMWVTFPVPSTQEAGEYVFRIQFDYDITFAYGYRENTAEITLVVCDAEIPASNEGVYSIEHFHQPDQESFLEHGGYNMKPYDVKWWNFMEEFTRSLRECRSNVFRIYPLYLLIAAGSRRIAQDQWHFDFSIFDQLVDFLNKNNTVKKFAIDDILTPAEAKKVFVLDENGEIIQVDIDEPLAGIWLDAYLSALYAHIQKHSDPKKWIMHIQDEPHDASSWLWGREYVRKNMPGIRYGNPFDVIRAKELVDEADLLIPIFSSVEDNVDTFAEIVNTKSKEIWPYCCFYPHQSWYLNRTIERPIMFGRLIAWATYSRGFSGFLHYGYCYWQNTEQFYPYSIQKYSMHKGDSMLIYPSAEDNSYRISVRYINIRDGAQDFELLKMAEKVDKERTLELSKKIAIGYRDFNTDENQFLEARKELLMLAEKCK